MSLETALSLASPYTCTSVYPLRYGWSAAAPHAHGLRAQRNAGKLGLETQLHTNWSGSLC
jgi:hypothetical protein